MIGAIVGFLVSLTSVAGGSLIIACMMVLYRGALRRIVGSDIVHALVLVGVAGIGYLGMGGINRAVLGTLLVGSVPSAAESAICFRLHWACIVSTTARQLLQSKAARRAVMP